MTLTSTHDLITRAYTHGLLAKGDGILDVAQLVYKEARNGRGHLSPATVGDLYRAYCEAQNSRDRLCVDAGNANATQAGMSKLNIFRRFAYSRHAAWSLVERTRKAIRTMRKDGNHYELVLTVIRLQIGADHRLSDAEIDAKIAMARR